MQENTKKVSRVEIRVNDFSQKDIARFWSKVNRNGSIPDQGNRHYVGLTSCWEWSAGCFANGYGQFKARRTYVAHRIAFALFKGRLNTEDLVCHACDNPKCCNPDHLFEGTYKDNRIDCVVKGRAMPARGDNSGARRKPERVARGDRHGSKTKPERVVRGDRHWSRTNPEKRPTGDRHGTKTHPERIARGEKQGGSKLTESQVRNIKRRYAEGGITMKALANECGVSCGAVRLIIIGQNWRHVAA